MVIVNRNNPSINSGSDKFKDSKCPCKVMKNNIKEISSGSTNNNDFFLVIFAGVALNLEKAGPTFSSLNLYQSLPSVATNNRKKFNA